LKLKDCVDNGVTPYVAQQRKNPGSSHGGVPKKNFCVDKFTYDVTAEVYIVLLVRSLSFVLSPLVMGRKNSVFTRVRNMIFFPVLIL
jgi:hypothetical protein